MKEQYYDANCLEVSAFTTGFMGGDAGYGGYAEIELKDICGTCMESVSNNDFIKITLRGDSEIETLYKAICFIKHAFEYYEPRLLKCRPGL